MDRMLFNDDVRNIHKLMMRKKIFALFDAFKKIIKCTCHAMSRRSETFEPVSCVKMLCMKV